MGKFVRALREPAIGLLVLSCVVAVSCKTTHPKGAETDDAAARKAGTTEQSSRVYQRGENAAQAAASNYPGSKPQETPESSSGDAQSEGRYEGGDPNIYHPPVHYGTPAEKIVKTSHSSTPTPTPDRPIDRPLDPAGRPLTSPTP
jgi:hypothetical protein